MTRIVDGVPISDRAVHLIEALHQPTGNEERWKIAQLALDEERETAEQRTNERWAKRCGYVMWPDASSATRP